MNTKTFSSGELIFREGELQLSLFEIQKGSVGIYRDYGTEQESLLTVLKAGKLFGEMGLLEASPRSATALAREDGTVLREISEEEFYSFLQDKPGLLLQILRQLSARIRENTEKYHAVCKTLAESEAAEESGEEKSGELQQQLESIGKVAEKKRKIQTGLRSSFFAYVQDDLEAYEGKREVVRASLFERLTVRRISPDEMHVNPDDEFTHPEVGPSDRIINEYAQELKRLWRDHYDVFPEPVVVYKIKPEGYLRLNGHHRWAAAVKSGFGKIRAVIMNPPR